MSKMFNRIIDINEYDINDDNNNYNLDDTVLCFYNGLKWIIINIDVMLKYPLLRYKFYSNKYEKYFTNTLLLCPITLRSMIFKGNIVIINRKYNTLILYNKDTKDTFKIDKPFTGYKDNKNKKKDIKSHIKRYEVRIYKLRHLFKKISDFNYINLKDYKKIKEAEYIFDYKYYSNCYDLSNKKQNTYIHPKTIVYVIQYYSHYKKKYLYQIVISNKIIEHKNIFMYSFNKDNMDTFLFNNIQKYIEKKAYIYPCMWFMIDKLYNEYDLIFI